jgi:hypothetical protein
MGGFITNYTYYDENQMADVTINYYYNGEGGYYTG